MAYKPMVNKALKMNIQKIMKKKIDVGQAVSMFI